MSLIANRFLYGQCTDQVVIGRGYTVQGLGWNNRVGIVIAGLIGKEVAEAFISHCKLFQTIKRKGHHASSLLATYKNPAQFCQSFGVDKTILFRGFCMELGGLKSDDG